MDKQPSYPVFDVSIFDEADEAGPVLTIQVPFFPYPGLLIVIDDAAWEVRSVQVAPYQGTALAQRLDEQQLLNLPLPVSVTAANTAPESVPIRHRP